MMIGSYGSHQCCHRPLNNCISLSFCFCSIRRFQIPKVGSRKFNVVRYNQTAIRHFRPQDNAKVVSRPRLSCGWKCLGANQTCTKRLKNIQYLNPPNQLLINLIKRYKRKFPIIFVLQSNLVIRNFLVSLILFLNAKCSLS